MIAHSARDEPTALVPPTRPRATGFLECAISPNDGSIVFPELRCPHGHVIGWENAFHEAGYPRCHHTERDSRTECGARLFLQFFPRVGQRLPPLLFIAEITYAEIKHIQAQGFDVPRILDYLGVRWHPPRIRVDTRRE